MSQKNNQSDISNISDLTTKYKKGDLLKHNAELRALAAAQDITIQKMHEELAKRDSEIQHLKSMLADMTPVIGKVERLQPSDEEMIVELQLEKLKNRARISELTLEEARKFEIYTKYKQNKKDNSIPITGRSVSDEETQRLLSAASQFIEPKKDEQ